MSAARSSRSVDALLVAGDFELSEHLRQPDEYGVPIALCVWEIDPPDTLPVVTIDYQKAGYVAGRHLRELGHRRLAVIADLPAHRPRADGARRAFAEDGIDIAQVLMAAAYWSAMAGRSVSSDSIAVSPKSTTSAPSSPRRRARKASAASACD